MRMFGFQFQVFIRINLYLVGNTKKTYLLLLGLWKWHVSKSLTSPRIT